MSIDEATPVPTADRAAWQEAAVRALATTVGLPPTTAVTWVRGLPARFSDARTPAQAAADIGLCLQPGASARLTSIGTASTLRLSWPDRPSLSHVIAVLDRLGIEVQNHTEWQLRGPEGDVHRLDDFTVGGTGVPDTPGTSGRLVDTLVAILTGRVDDDGFNRLVLTAGIGWQQAAWVRCWYRYLRQTGLPLGLRYVEEALARHPAAVTALVGLFRARFDPAVTNRDETERRAHAAASSAVDGVLNRDDTRILQAGLRLVEATLRTNAFLSDEAGRPLPRLSIKVDPTRLDWAPQPRPFREVFVHSPGMEGLHLRATAVSRGGIRWSDRPEDLRTEVLGLMKAQQVKNAGIVPGGAKLVV